MKFISKSCRGVHAAVPAAAAPVIMTGKALRPLGSFRRGTQGSQRHQSLSPASLQRLRATGVKRISSIMRSFVIAQSAGISVFAAVSDAEAFPLRLDML
ncbi:hypothetical protein ASG39_01505 [Rhizobium sp. Leaf371]|nr:hypothetical protein ASG39_01505 [Rhizobium sp. Leaf371]